MKKTNGPQDLHVDEFVQLLSTLPADQPITKAFEKAWAMERQRQTQDTGQWYRKQKEHVIEWFASLDTLGVVVYYRVIHIYNASTALNRYFFIDMLLL